MLHTRSAVVLAALVLAACSSSQAPQPSAPTVSSPPAAAVKPTTPGPPAPDAHAPLATYAVNEPFADGNAELAIDLLRATTATGKPGENVFLSPYSVSVALAMAYAGADGTTATEMRAGLHLGVPDDQVAPEYGRLDAALATRVLQLDIASAVWGQTNLAFEQPFLDTLANGYGAPLQTIDFAGDPVAATKAIDAWGSAQTYGKIPDAVDPNSITNRTRMVLANAVYFNGSWLTPFDPPTTITFTDDLGASTSIPMMGVESQLPYTHGADYQAVLVPYADESLALLAIVPSAGGLASLESSLTGTQVIDMFAAMSPADVVLTLPTIHLDEAHHLNAPLQSLGMTSMFGGANFDRETTQESLAVSEVYQRTMTDITPKGTVAAAVTTVVEGGDDAAPPPPPPPTVVRADHPFLFAIVDRPTKTLLFLGHIAQPPTPATN